ncbi:epoxide hydrolase family protein [Microlunatus parietis]|uniref:Pimeloyl-ACP methyl ester carboxylesterase n=1 Tax=Microlunatus parietis TaxID=682979 RepID=A0A7Y9I345_9ACTN|nr:epoxide hydrolase family protein [Microlunatus parietis]NYE69341.1 pimeloyl-ACP methyl ester carboxylesterase [Microlunatus parietis]
MEPFTVQVPESVLSDLADRLSRTRWSRPWDRPGWEDGVDQSYLRDLVAWWQDGFSWRAREAELNRYDHFRAAVRGTVLHFVVVRARRPKGRMPLLLCHGWPSTFYELLPLADRLSQVDVVIPSLPGYGFSDPLDGFRSANRIPALYAGLMTEVLGYSRFGIHGGDIGAMVANRLALERPDLVAGVHVTMPAEPYLEPGTGLTEDEQAFLRDRRISQERGTAYAHLQRTRPATPAHALADSPAGLAAWIVEKWRDWSDCDGRIERRFTKDQLLTTVMLYWVTNTIGTSFRIYRDWALASEDTPQAWPDDDTLIGGVAGAPLPPGRRIEVPAAVALFHVRQPREWAERAYANLQRWSPMPSGGHFAAMEEPDLLADDISEFFSAVER